MTAPRIGQTVHYRSFGSVGGKFPPRCRAAVVTETHADAASLAVLNPTGLFFDQGIRYDEGKAPGTWHWPCIEDPEYPEHLPVDEPSRGGTSGKPGRMPPGDDPRSGRPMIRR